MWGCSLISVPKILLSYPSSLPVCTTEVERYKSELQSTLSQLQQTQLQLREKTGPVQDFLQVGGGVCDGVGPAQALLLCFLPPVQSATGVCMLKLQTRAAAPMVALFAQRQNNRVVQENVAAIGRMDCEGRSRAATATRAVTVSRARSHSPGGYDGDASMMHG
jgi:hypothetical protein